MHSAVCFGLLALAGFSAAQVQYEINPETVAPATRSYWCDQQRATCPSICLQQPGVTSMNTANNDCDPDKLVANCVCDNGLSPNLTQYTQTLPYNICTQWGSNCVADCGLGNNKCADSCRADHPCGAQDPYKGNATASASSGPSATAKASKSVPLTGFAGETNSPNKSGASSSLANHGMAVAIFGIVVSLTLL